MTTLPTITQDVWKPATDQEKAAALASLAGLPSRTTSSESLDRAAYYLALEGVTRFGLSEAVKAIMKGVLGHAFMPSPPELRIQIDKAMEHHEAMRERIARRERSRAEAPPELPPLTDAQKDRQRRLMAKFHGGIDKTKAAEEAARVQAEREDIRARYGMTPEALSSVQDNPKARERMGNS